MKKLLVMMLVVVMSIVMLTGCESNVEDAGHTESSDVVGEENTENSEAEVSDVEESDAAESESFDTSEETSEAVEETTMYSADEVMAHIDTLIAQFQYNNPEHIKALVIAANLDYISEEDLSVILTEYGYSMEELAVLYDECILDNGASRKLSTEYSQGNADSISMDDKFNERIDLESSMVDSSDKEFVKWYDQLLLDMSNGEALPEQREVFVERIQNCSDEMTYVERTTFSYTCGIFINSLSYTDYLDNPYTYYINSNL